MKQLALTLAAPPAPTLDNFVAGRNGEVLAALRALAAGVPGEPVLLLWGAPGSGCSHLLRAALAALAAAGRDTGSGVAAAAALAEDGVLGVDDVQRLGGADQIALFNACNRLKAGGGVLIAAADAPPARLRLRDDLRTRLASGLVYEVHALSDDDRRAALAAYAAARGFALPAEVAAYLLARVPRDLATLRALVDTLDRVSLERKRPLTVPLAREVLRLLKTPDGAR
jgi:DnaA family protein